jgi:hypothetical protein
VLCASGPVATDHPCSSTFSPSLSEGGRCTLPLREFKFHPYGSMARAATRAIRFLGLRALYGPRKQAIKGGAVSEPYHKHLCSALRGCRLSESRRPKLLKAIGAYRKNRRSPNSSHAGGHRFESCRAHHSFQTLTNCRVDLLIIKQGDTDSRFFIDESFQTVSSASGPTPRLKTRDRSMTVSILGRAQSPDIALSAGCPRPMACAAGSGQLPKLVTRDQVLSPPPLFS